MVTALKKVASLFCGTIAITVFLQPQIILANDDTPLSLSDKVEATIVRIDLTKSDKQGSGVIVGRKQNVYTVLTTWHVVNTSGEYIIQTNKERYIVSYSAIKRVGDLDLAELEFTSNQVYQYAERGNSNDIQKNGELVYVSGWINPTQSIVDRTFNTDPGKFLTRSQNKLGKVDLVVSLSNPNIGMSGGAFFDRNGRLIGIIKEGYRDPITGAVGSISGTAINDYANFKGLSIPASSPLTGIRDQYPRLNLSSRMEIQIQEIDAEIVRLSGRFNGLPSYYRSSFSSEEIQSIGEELQNLYRFCDELDRSIDNFRQLFYENESKFRTQFADKYVDWIREKVYSFKSRAASLRADLDRLSVKVKN
jgi:hypothetical protein